MKFNEVFGVLLILLAIYLAVNATGRDQAATDLFNGDSSVAGEPDTDRDHDKYKDDKDDHADKDKDKDKDHDRGKDDDKDGHGNEGVVSTSDFCAASRDSRQFDDLGSANDEAIRCMAYAGVVSGVSEDRYAPRDALTRAQAASTIEALIVSANRLERPGVDLHELEDAPSARFIDVPPRNAHAGAIARLNQAGILTGYVDARFEPQGRVSRAQMASILDRTYKFLTDEALPGGSDQFDDDHGSVHHDAINAVATAGIMDGTGGGEFDPNLAVRRGPMATYAARLMIRLEETGRIRPLD